MIINTNNLVNLATDKLEVKYVQSIGEPLIWEFNQKDDSNGNFSFQAITNSTYEIVQDDTEEKNKKGKFTLTPTGNNSARGIIKFPQVSSQGIILLKYETKLNNKCLISIVDTDIRNNNLPNNSTPAQNYTGAVFYQGGIRTNKLSNNIIVQAGVYYKIQENYAQGVISTEQQGLYANGEKAIETTISINMKDKTMSYKIIDIENNFVLAEETEVNFNINTNINKIDGLEFYTYGTGSTPATIEIDNLTVTISENPKENTLYIIPDSSNDTGKLYIYNEGKFILIGDNSSIVDKYVASATFDSINSKIILIFTDESTIEIPLGDLKVDMSNIQTKKLTVTSSKSTDNTLIEPLKVRDDRIDIFKTTQNYGTDNQVAVSNVVIKKDESIKIDNIKLELTDAAVLDAHKVLTDDGDDGGLQVGNTLKIQDGMIKLGYNANDDSYNSYIECGQKDDDNDSVQELVIATKNNKQGVRISDNSKIVSIFANQIKLAYDGSNVDNSNAAIDTSASDVSNGIKLRARENNSKGGRNNLVVEQNEVRICGDINLKDVSTNCVQLPDDVTEEEIAYLEGSLQNTLINLKRDMTNLLNTIKGLETKVAALENATT